MRTYFIIISIVVGVLLGLIIYDFGFVLSGGSFFQTIKPVVEIAAIIIGGLWTYDRFIKYREDYPYFEITHQVEHVEIVHHHSGRDCDGKGYFFLRVYVIVSNKGKVKLDLSNAVTFVRQVLPLIHPVLSSICPSPDNTEKIRRGDVNDLFLDKELMKIGWPQLAHRDWKVKLTEGKSAAQDKKLGLEPGQTKIYPLDFY